MLVVRRNYFGIEDDRDHVSNLDVAPISSIRLKMLIIRHRLSVRAQKDNNASEASE